MQVLAMPSLPDETCSLYALRLNALGMSTRELGLECDVAGGTIDRIEAGAGCQPRVAKSIADRFALSVSELFNHDSDTSPCARSANSAKRCSRRRNSRSPDAS
jgi:DNA-binding XRE family transcriptional regulator